jgi:hypothetical protein
LAPADRGIIRTHESNLLMGWLMEIRLRDDVHRECDIASDGVWLSSFGANWYQDESSMRLAPNWSALIP